VLGVSQRSVDFFSAANSRSGARWWRWRRDFFVLSSESEVDVNVAGAAAVAVGAGAGDSLEAPVMGALSRAETVSGPAVEVAGAAVMLESVVPVSVALVSVLEAG
jgi:hypothetical protein